MGKEEEIKTKSFTRKAGTVDLARDRKSNAVSTKSLRRMPVSLHLEFIGSLPSATVCVRTVKATATRGREKESGCSDSTLRSKYTRAPESERERTEEQEVLSCLHQCAQLVCTLPHM